MLLKYYNNEGETKKKKIITQIIYYFVHEEFLTTDDDRHGTLKCWTDGRASLNIERDFLLFLQSRTAHFWRLSMELVKRSAI